MKQKIRELYAAVQPVPLEKEIILVDDGSTDGTRETIAGLIADNAQVFFS